MLRKLVEMGFISIQRIVVGCADVDEFSKFEEVNGWFFLITEAVDSEYRSFIKEIPEADGSLVDIVSEGNDAKSIRNYLFSIDAVGRSLDFHRGSIRCAIEGDLAGLPDLIASSGISVDVFPNIPEEIGSEHHGRLFVICEKFTVDQEFGRTTLSHELTDSRECEGISIAITA